MPLSPIAHFAEADRSSSPSAALESTIDSPNSNPDEIMSDDEEGYEEVDEEEENEELEEEENEEVEEDGEDEVKVEGEENMEGEHDGEEELEVEDDGEEESQTEEDGDEEEVVEGDGKDQEDEVEVVPGKVGPDESEQNTEQANKLNETGDDLPESPLTHREYSDESKKIMSVDVEPIASMKKSNFINEGPKSSEFGSNFGIMNEHEQANSNFARECLDKIPEWDIDPPNGKIKNCDTLNEHFSQSNMTDYIPRRVSQTEHSSYGFDKEYSKETMEVGVTAVEKVQSHSDIKHYENTEYPSFDRVKKSAVTVGQRNILAIDKDTMNADVMKEISSSLPAPHISPGSFSLGNKTSDAICEFFAKGWCIKGSSCKFVHLKSLSSTTSRHFEGLTHDEERPGSSRSTFQPDYSFKMKSTPASDFVSDKMHIGEYGRKRNWSQFCNDFSNEQDSYLLRSTSPFKSAGSLNSGFTTFPPSRNITSSSQNVLSSQTSFDAASCLQASKSSPSASFLRNSPSFSGYDTGHVGLTDHSKVTKFSHGYKPEIFSYDWVPSVPFRPSVFIPPSKVSSPGSQYDPLRDSIEPSTGQNDQYSGVLSYVGGGSRGLSSGEHANGKYVAHKFDTDFMSDKYSVFGTNIHNDSMVNKKIAAIEVNPAVDMEEPVGNSVSINVKRDIDFNENALPIISSLNEIGKSEKFSRLSDPKHRKNLDKEFKPHKDDIRNDANGDVYKETKIQRHFRTVLVDFVKDLVKPSWRVGLVSKDSHNLIVKKAVDKVLGTMHPHQMPSSFDAIKHYILAAEPKITKLVEGYIEKYGKS